MMIAALDLHRRVLSLRVRGHLLDSSIDPHEFDHPVLAAELGDELLGLKAGFGFSDGTIYNFRKAVVSLLKGLPSSLPAASSMSGDGLVLADAMHSWERSLAARFPPTSQIPGKHPRMIRQLIKLRAARQLPVGVRVSHWAHAKSLNPVGRDRPLDEHSNEERLAIRDGCRDRIRDLERRLRIGRALLPHGRDPREHRWETLPNLLWAVRHLARPGSPSIVTELGAAALQLPGDDQMRMGRLDHVEPSMRGRRTLDRLLALLYPTEVDLIAFRSLLQLETGAAQEELSHLTLDDLEWRGEDQLSLRLRKSRARRSRTVQLFCGPAGGWRGGDIVRRLLEATETARAEAEADHGPHADRVFLTVTKLATQTVSVRAGATDGRSYSALLKSLPGPISMPHDPRRLRKTVESVRAAVLRSIESAAGDDHTVAVFQSHYAQSTTVHVLAGAAINAAQTQVFDRLREGPTFVPRRAAEVLTGDGSAPVAAAARAELAQGDVDRVVNVAQCSDPYASPFTATGRLCEHRPAGCFACPNAIVFRDHLPRLLAYRTVLEDHQREMTPSVFAATHGQQLANLDLILTEFSDDEKAAARATLDTITAAVHVPLSQRGTHL